MFGIGEKQRQKHIQNVRMKEWLLNTDEWKKKKWEKKRPSYIPLFSQVSINNLCAHEMIFKHTIFYKRQPAHRYLYDFSPVSFYFVCFICFYLCSLLAWCCCSSLSIFFSLPLLLALPFATITFKFKRSQFSSLIHNICSGFNEKKRCSLSQYYFSAYIA